MNSLLGWSSFPVLVLAVFLAIEALPLVRRDLRGSRWWRIAAWFWRPWAVWAVFNIVYRIFAKHGFNDRCVFPFYFSPWVSRETWSGAFSRLTQNPEFWRWSLAVLLLGVLLLLLFRWVFSGALTRRKTAAALGCLVLLSTALPLAYDGVPAGIGDPWNGSGSFGTMWIDSGNTMLYCLPVIQSKGDYLRNFERLQPKLTLSIHGADHPPGASLALYWLAKPFGVQKGVDKDIWRYELATAVFASLCVLGMFFLGWSIAGSSEAGLMAAALWAVKPSSLAYNVFAPDTVYWVFYILCFAFSWRVVMAEKRAYGSMVGLGVVWAILSMLNFNFPMPVAMFGVFLLLHAWRHHWRAAEWLWRAAVPAAVATLLFLWVCVHYDLDYLGIFLYGLKHYSFYHLDTVYKWTTALIGGQIDLYLMAGSVVAYVFWRAVVQGVRKRPLDEVMVYVLVILVIYIVPILFMNSLKMEASRVWTWVTAVPLVMVACALRRSEHPRFYFLSALVLSMLQYYGMRLLLVSAG